MASLFVSPIGMIQVTATKSGVSSLIFIDDKEMESRVTGLESLENEMESRCKVQLNEYFNRKRTLFDLPLDLQGSEFQKRVWLELLKIPFGRTISYKELTLKLGDIMAIRAVAAANGANPLSIIVPCHRVIGSDGSLTGYAGGLWRKQWLLEFESKENLLF